MTELFSYDVLSWPEIAALPRDTPLIIPLGTGYAIQDISSALGNPPRAGILPAIPFGWRGSGLAVEDDVLSRMISNLIFSLRDDGFTQVHALVPPGLQLDIGEQSIILPNPNQKLQAPRIPNDRELNKVILIPIGHTEQHGFHLPMSTDTLIINAISQGVVASAHKLAVSLPVMPYGVSTHRSAFAGTLNCGGRAFEDFWLSVVDVLTGRGFNKFYFMSGHGGNSSFLANVVKYAGERHRRIFCATSWLYLSGPKGIAALEEFRQSQIGGMGHACELETSLILQLTPELVHMERVVDELEFITTPSYYMDWVEGGALVANPPWDDDSRTGAYGAGSFGTAEKGRQWLRVAIDEKVDHVSEIIEQHERREQRRITGYGLWGK